MLLSKRSYSRLKSAANAKNRVCPDCVNRLQQEKCNRPIPDMILEGFFAFKLKAHKGLTN